MDNVDLYLRPSPNQSSRHDRPILLCVIHYTATRTAEQILDWYANPKSKSSAHYVIGRDGVVYQCVSEDNCAYHAGISKWRGLEIISLKSGRPTVNPVSIGVKLVNSGLQECTEEQFSALNHLADTWRLKYPQLEYVGHRHISPERGRDPGPAFIWNVTSLFLPGG